MITLRLDKNGGINKGDVKAFEHDNLSEVYIIQLYKNGAIYDLTNKTVELTMVERKRKIGDMINLPIYEATEGKVKLEVVSDITKQDGIYDFKLTVKDTTGLIETFPNFQVEIKNDITDSITGEIIQDPNFTILTDGLKALADYNIYKTNALKVPDIEQDIVDINSQLDTNMTDINLLKDNKINYTDKLNIITPEMFGAKADGATDDTVAIKNCINYAMENNKTVFFTHYKTYCATSININKPCSVNFNGAILKNILTDATTPFLIIGDKNYTFEQKTTYSNKYNISNIAIDMDLRKRQYAVALFVRHFSLDRIYLRNCSGDGVYCGTNDGIWINEILAFSDSSDINNTSSGVIIDANDIILGNVECAYFKNGVKVIQNLNDIEINKLHVWSDAIGSCCIKYEGTTFYGHINGLIIDCVEYGIDTSNITGYGKMKIDNIMVFPSVNFPNWKVCKPSFDKQTMGITIGSIFGISDNDTINRFSNFYGIIQSNNNYNQNPRYYDEFSQMSGSGFYFKQINGMLYQDSWCKITLNGSNDLVLGVSWFLRQQYSGMTLPIYLVDSNYSPLGIIAGLTIASDNTCKIRFSDYSRSGTHYFKIMIPLAWNYYYYV